MKTRLEMPGSGGGPRPVAQPAPAAPAGGPAHQSPAAAPLRASHLILVCDHRGARLAEKLHPLELEGCRTRISRSLRQSLEALAQERPAVLVLAPMGPEGGAEIEALHRTRARLGDVPLLIVQGPAGPAPLLGSLRRIGAQGWDMIQPDASLDEFAMRIARLLEDRRRIAEMRELRHRASHDDRTDLLRPRAFQARLSEHVSAAGRHGLDLALVLIDLDQFGRINKEHDHTVGDALIARVGEVVRKTLRTEDIAGRLGGDEFAVLLPYTRYPAASNVVERLCAEIHKLAGRFGGTGEFIHVSASLGYETFSGKDLKSVAVLRTNAERALRAAKTAGGNRALYFRALEPSATTG